MIHVTASDLRKQLAHYLDRAVDDRDMVLVTRQGAEPVVMVALSEWEGLKETLFLRSNPANAARLDEAIAALDAGEGFEVEWDEKSQAYKRT